MVACTDVLIGGNGCVNLAGLLADKVDNRVNGVSKLGSDSANYRNIVDHSVCGDLTAENYGIVFDHRFNATMAVSVLGKTLRKDGIGNLVGKLVGVIFTDLFC